MSRRTHLLKRGSKSQRVTPTLMRGSARISEMANPIRDPLWLIHFLTPSNFRYCTSPGSDLYQDCTSNINNMSRRQMERSN